jgi:hypothetical protein
MDYNSYKREWRDRSCVADCDNVADRDNVACPCRVRRVVPVECHEPSHGILDFGPHAYASCF